MKPAALLATVFLGLVAAGHLLRFALAITVVVDGIAVPMWPSVFASAGTGLLAVWLWREQRGAEVRGA